MTIAWHYLMDINFINKFFGIKYSANSAVKMSLDILNAIYDMECKDYESINYSECHEKYTLIAHQHYHTGSISSEDSHKQKELEKIFQELRIRFYARITAYVTTISQLEGHLQYHFGVLYGAKESSYRKKINISLLNWNIEFNVSAKSLKYAAKVQTKDTKKEFKARRQEIKSYILTQAT